MIVFENTGKPPMVFQKKSFPVTRLLIILA